MASFDPENDIENAEAVTEVFGHWPTFHDAEIRSLTLFRGPGAPSLECSIHVFEMTPEVDARGYYVCKNHTLVQMRFGNIALYELKWFNQQNAIDELEIDYATDGEGRYAVHFPSNSGCEARFNCESIRVVSVEPYTAEHRTLESSIYAAPTAGEAP